VQGLPLSDLKSLAMCSSQVIGDMEGADVIPDVRLLCRLVVADENIRKTLRHKAPDLATAPQPMLPGVPRVAAALVKELVRMSNRETRRGVILRYVESVLVMSPARCSTR
jgi:hypothetical protein